MEIIPPLSHMPPWRARGQFAFYQYVNMAGDIRLVIGPSFYFDCSGHMHNNVSHNSIGAACKATLKSQPVKRSAVPGRSIRCTLNRATQSGVHYTGPLNPVYITPGHSIRCTLNLADQSGVHYTGPLNPVYIKPGHSIRCTLHQAA